MYNSKEYEQIAILGRCKGKHISILCMTLYVSILILVKSVAIGTQDVHELTQLSSQKLTNYLRKGNMILHIEKDYRKSLRLKRDELTSSDDIHNNYVLMIFD